MSSEENDIVTHLRAGGRSRPEPLLCDIAADAIVQLRAEVERLRTEVADYRNGVNWHTACTNCANLMHDNYNQHCEIERLRAAGDALAEAFWLRRPLTNRSIRAIEAWDEARREQ